MTNDKMADKLYLVHFQTSSGAFQCDRRISTSDQALLAMKILINS